ncbi:MAG: DUF1573 domain-containing protein [Bacteroidota bacterium]
MKHLAITLILCVFSIGLMAQNSDNPDNDKKSGPDISFDKTEHDYGTIARKSNGDCTFTLTNKGNEPLVLTNVKSSCGCAAVSWPRKPVKPGDSAEIKIRYDTKRLGSFSKSIKVYNNATDAPVELTIKGTVEKK